LTIWQNIRHLSVILHFRKADSSFSLKRGNRYEESQNRIKALGCAAARAAASRVLPEFTRASGLVFLSCRVTTHNHRKKWELKMDSLVDVAYPALPRGRKVLGKSPYIAALQRRHFYVFDVAPNVAALLAVPYHVFVAAVRPSDLLMFLALWAATGIGITAGYHRLFAHRAYKAHDRVRAILAFCGALAGQGPVVSWAAIHRRHHELSDQEGDPHSPNLHGRSLGGRLAGLLHAHYTWMIEHDYPNAAHYAADLLRDRAILWVNRNYYAIAVGGLVAPGLVGLALGGTPLAFVSGVLWGGFIRMVVLGHTIWAINSVLHCVGSRPFATGEGSHNAGSVALLTFGESWHNNHHAFPSSAKFGLRRGWTDPGWWTISALERAGLASGVREPSDALIDEKLKGAHRL
jgi:stearoyl-CoA desaturase (Delta-9 desaturase)